MGWFGRYSIRIFLKDFEAFLGSNDYNKREFEIIVKNFVDVIVDASGLSLTEFLPSSRPFKETLFLAATRISKPRAKLVASEVLQVGIKLRKVSGSENAYFANALIAAYFQAVAETNGLDGKNNRSMSYLRSLGMFSTIVEYIDKFAFQSEINHAH